MNKLRKITIESENTAGDILIVEYRVEKSKKTKNKKHVAYLKKC